MSHYDTLQVVPWADDAVIRAAYRALMREYHPDTNPAPGAQTRARQIAAAFAIIGDRQNRATYDALPALGNSATAQEFAASAPRNGPGRRIPIGAAAISLAAVLSFGIALGPDHAREPSLQHQRKTLGTSRAVIARMDAGGTGSLADHLVVQQAAAPAEPQVIVRAAPMRQLVHGPLKGEIVPAAEPALAKIMPKPRAALMAMAEIQQASSSPASSQLRSARAPATISDSQTRSGCAAGAGTDDDGCTNERQKQIENIARSFLQQSLDHADGHKQQLLLSARLRAATSRAICRSGNCVTQAYLRQIADTTTIMAGRVPTP